MNVMAEAHKLARTVVSHAPGKGVYAYTLKHALIHFHKEFKAMQTQEIDLNKLYQESVRVNTHELKEGDVILHHWCLFKLVNRRVYTYASDLQHDEKGTVQFDTECLHRGEDSPIPTGWINRAGGWTIQGNSRAQWSKVSK